MSKKWIIYKYTCPEKRCYIGQTVNEHIRQKVHRDKENSEKDTTKFATAIREIGYENFVYEVVETVYSQEEANEREKYWIGFYDSVNSGYNKRNGGNSEAYYRTITDDDITNIASALKNSNKTQSQIAEFFDVGVYVVNSVKQGTYRPHVSSEVIMREDMMRKGSTNGQSKLTEEQTKEIKEKLAAGVKRKDIQVEYGVSKTLVQLIATNQAWNHVEADYTYKKKETNGNARLDRDTVYKLKLDLKQGMSVINVSAKYDISVPTVYQIKREKTWKDVVV